MREAIGGTWLFQIVIFFVLLFTGYMCLSINYSKAFSVKDKIINEIERNGGIKKMDTNTLDDDPTIKEITNYLKKVGYRTVGKCRSNNDKEDQYDYGCDRNGRCSLATTNKTYAYCISEKKNVTEVDNPYAYITKGEFIYISYYKVKVFYNLDLPVIREWFEFSIKGDTRLNYKMDNVHK